MSLLEAIGFGIALLGSFVVLVAALGVVRFPDLFTRMHAVGVIDTGGALLVLTGLSLAAGLSTETGRMLLILAFMWVTSPTASHALAKTARAAGQEPHIAVQQLVTGDGRLEDDLALPQGPSPIPTGVDGTDRPHGVPR